MPACVDHVYSAYGAFYNKEYRVPQKSTWSLSQSLGAWVNDEQDEFNYRHVDVVEWPENSGCSRI